MSQENVEIVRRAYGAWNAGDMDALRDLYDPGAIIVRQLEGWPEGPDASVGREAVIRVFEQMRAARKGEALEPTSLTDAGDRVVVSHVWRGADYGSELKLEFAVVFTLRDGRIFLVENFSDNAEALKALGLKK